MDLSPVAAAISDEGIESRRQGDRPRRRRRPRFDRRRHRHRHHLRQGDRVGRPPARDERRAAEHPLARLRADRGRRLLHLHLRPDRLLPLGRSMELFRPHSGAPASRPRTAEEEGGSFLVSPGPRPDDLDAGALPLHDVGAEQGRLPEIQEALDKRAKTITESIEAAERQRKESDELLAEYRGAPRGGTRAGRRHQARARKAAETAEAEATAEGKEKREELVAAAKRDIEAETRRSLDQIRKEVADLTVLATEKVTRKSLNPGPESARRRGAQRGRLLHPPRAGDQQIAEGEGRSRIRRGPLRRGPRHRQARRDQGAARRSSPTRSPGTARCSSSCSAPTSPRPRSSRGDGEL